MTVQAGVQQGQYRYTAGLAAANTALKEWYRPGIVDNVNSATIGLMYFNRRPLDAGGQSVQFEARTGRNQGRGYVWEFGQLPDPKRQQLARGSYITRNGYGRVLLTGQALSASRSDRGAFMRLLDVEMRGLAVDLAAQDNRIIYGDGSGRLARVSAVAAAPTYGVDQPGGFANPGSGTQYLETGMRVAFHDNSATPANFRAEVRTITSVDYVAGTITLDGTITSAGIGDYVHLASDTALTMSSGTNYLSSNFNAEPFGLAAIVADTNPALRNLGNISASTNAWWQSYIVDNGGTAVPFAQTLLNQAQDGVEQLGGGTVKMWLTSHGIRRKLVEQLLQGVRYVNTMELKGGYRAVEYNDRPVVPDKDCTRGRVYGIDPDLILMYQEFDWDWIDDGSVLVRLPDHDAYQAAMFKYWEMGTEERNKLCAVLDIQDS